jgi:hypothetical protein
MKEYLPSRQFIARLIILAIILGLVFGIYEVTMFFKHRAAGKNQAKPLLIKDIVQKDTNTNGIPDWEESLWGLDPAKDGPANKEFILAKRETMAKENGIDPNNDEPLSENEMLSREFFAVVMSLQQSGNLDSNSMQAVADAIGQKITAEPIADVYTKKDAVLSAEEPSLATIQYFTAYLNLNTKYKDKNIGDELTFIAAAIKDDDKGAIKVVSAVADAYRSFGKELLKIPVPSSLLLIHLDLANNYEKVAQSIDQMTKLLDEPLGGMKGLINYKKYDDLLVEDIGKLTDNFN